jgi:hypothetical protein
MLEMLARAAWADGIRVFEAWVHRDDAPLLNMLIDSGFSTTRRLDDGYCRVTLSLTRTPQYEDRAAERSATAATASMKAFFEPKTVAVIGASRGRGKIGAEIPTTSSRMATSAGCLPSIRRRPASTAFPHSNA